MADKKQKPVTEGYLERAALHYLGRFSSSRKNLIDVLLRKIQRRTGQFDVSNEHRAWAAAAADKCVRLGYVNDEAYAATRAETMQRRGKPLRMIRQDLRQKGITAEVIEKTLARLEGDDGDNSADDVAIVAYMRRRGFGVYRRADRGYGEDREQKELASMARAGFSFERARRALTLDRDEAEEILSR